MITRHKSGGLHGPHAERETREVLPERPDVHAYGNAASVREADGWDAALGRRARASVGWIRTLRSDGSLGLPKHCVDQASLQQLVRAAQKRRVVMQVFQRDCFHRAAWKLVQADVLSSSSGGPALT